MGSVIARGCRHSGLSLKRMLENIFERTRSYTSFLMPSSFHRLGMLTGKSPEDVLDGHTVFPYSVAFMQTEQRDRLRMKALSINIQKDCLGSLTKSVSFGVPFRRVCPDCLIADYETYGEAFWHRSHLLPAVHTCILHGTQLRETNFPLKRHANECNISFPSEAIQKSISRIAPRSILVAMTAASNASLHSKPNSASAWHKVYRCEAINRGYCVEGGNVASKTLSQAVAEFFGSEFLSDCGCEVTKGTTSSWPSLMARENPGVPFSPVKHLLMQTFFNLNTDALSNATVDYSRPGKKPDDCLELDDEVFRKLNLEMRKLKLTGSRRTVQQLLRLVGVWGKFRHNRDKFAKTNALIQSFRKSDQSERQLGKRKRVYKGVKGVNKLMAQSYPGRAEA